MPSSLQRLRAGDEIEAQPLDLNARADIQNVAEEASEDASATVSQVSSSDSTDETSLTSSEAFEEVITKAFLQGQSQWIDEPVINRWHKPDEALLSALANINQLYHEWKQRELAPFDPFLDRLWLESAEALQKAGLPWHNNNLNLPDEVDTRCVHILR